MHTTLICTVGGSHQPVVKAIQEIEPDKVLFVCSDDDAASGNKGSYQQILGKGLVIKKRFQDDKPSLPNIPAQTGLNAEQFEVIRVSPDDFDDVYSRVNEWLQKHQRNSRRLLADYTGGTKTMSAALAVVALDTPGMELQLVSGSRADLRKVADGSEYVLPAGVGRARFSRQLDQAMLPWRRYAYDESARLLQNLQAPLDAQLRAEYQRALDLSRALAAWDRFQHQQAREILERYRAVLAPDESWRQWLNDLGLLVRQEPEYQPMRLFDLLNNARRRAAQGRYDDAVARLYRLFEWSAQWVLGVEAGIATEDVPEEAIPPHIRLPANSEGKRQAGLLNAWELAAWHGEESVAGFWRREKNHLLDMLRIRNYSILAHGFEPIGDSQWQRMEAWAVDRLSPLLLTLCRKHSPRIGQISPQLPSEHFSKDDYA